MTCFLHFSDCSRTVLRQPSEAGPSSMLRCSEAHRQHVCGSAVRTLVLLPKGTRVNEHNLPILQTQWLIEW
jgi:hypothetical protein